MAELRWILLAAGLALIAGLYLWGMRSRSRSVAAERGRPIAAEPSQQVEPRRVEPQVRLEDAPREVGDAAPAVEAVDAAGPAMPSGRREPTLDEESTAPQPRVAEVEPQQPRFEAAEDVESGTAVESRAQRIIALRVTAPLPSRFEGSLLQEALQAEHFTFGRYQIYHRLDPTGRPVVSLASLREPGTFDPATMAGAAYAGVALFGVLPGPLNGQQAFEELLNAARSLASRLGGHVQDDRGAPLTAQRVARLREEMLAFDRSRADSARR